MTPHPYIISRDAYYYEAMSSFRMNGIKHLPVMDGGRVIGMVTPSDLLQQWNCFKRKCFADIGNLISQKNS